MKDLDPKDDQPALGPPVRPESPTPPARIWRPSPNHPDYETDGIETRQKQ